jgi:hypothetical protein
MQKASEGFQKIDQKEFAKRKDEIKAALDKMKAKADKTAEIITKLTELSKNPWIPVPIMELIEEEEKIEKINEDIEVNALAIRIGSLTNTKETRTYLQLTLPYNNERSVNDLINNPGKNEYNYINTLRFERGEFQSLPRRTLEITLFRKGWCCLKGTQLGKFKLKLEALKSSSEIVGDFDIKAENEGTTVKSSLLPSLGKINLSIKTRVPTAGKEFQTFIKTTPKITKIFPSFETFEDGEKKSFITNSSVVQKQDLKEIEDEINFKSKVLESVSKDTSRKPTSDIIKPKISNNKVSTANENVKMDASEFTREEIEDPDVIDNLKSVKVLEFKISKVDAKMKKIEGRAPRELRDTFLKMRVKLKKLQEELGENITIDQYIYLIKMQFDHDNKLLQYFKNEKMIEKAKLVAERIPLLKGELEEAIQFSKAKK